VSFLRRLPLSRLILLCGAVVIAGASAALAAALGAGGPKPAPQPLANAVHDALVAPAVAGVDARISFTNNLLGASGLQGNSPVLSGGSGRLWASADGRLRLELQSDRGDVELFSDGRSISYLDGASNTVYRFALPQSAGQQGTEKTATPAHGVPTVTDIQGFLTRLMQHVDVSGAAPDDVAGRPAYHVTISPSRDGGLLGGAELWWDAVHAVPLRVAVFAAHRSDPVLELTVTHIRFGTVAASVFAAPSAAKVVQVHGPTATSARAAARRGAARHRQGHALRAGGARRVGVHAVQAQLPFTLSAPATLQGLARSKVQTLDWGGHPAALVTYGQGPGGLVVIERPADSAGGGAKPSSPPPGHDGAPTLPSILINGSRGTELVTALGSVVQFQRGTVDYIVAGSVPGAVAEGAARAL
jgi:hypothetical protein